MSTKLQTHESVTNFDELLIFTKNNLLGNDKILKGQWNSTEDQILLEFHQNQKVVNWAMWALKIGNSKTPEMWRVRLKKLKMTKKIGRFTKEEDDKIIEAYKLYGKNWTLIAKKIGTNRDYKQIRERYTQHLSKNMIYQKSNKLLRKNSSELLEHLAVLYDHDWNYISQKLMPEHTPDQLEMKYSEVLFKNNIKEQPKRKTIPMNLGTFGPKSPIFEEQPNNKLFEWLNWIRLSYNNEEIVHRKIDTLISEQMDFDNLIEQHKVDYTPFFK